MLPTTIKLAPGTTAKVKVSASRKGYAGPLSVELFYPHLQKADPYEVAAEIRRKAAPILRQAGVS